MSGLQDAEGPEKSIIFVMRRWRKWYLKICVSLLLVGLIGLFSRANPMNDRPYFQRTGPLNIAHRGAARHAPENTLVAFEEAVEMGADILELDVHLTRDRDAVVIHDATVDRTTNGTGKVAEMTFEQIDSLDAGYWFSPDNGKTYPYRGKGVGIPALRDVLERFPDRRVNLELKTAERALAETVLRTIRDSTAEDRVLVASFSDEAIRYFRKISDGRVVTSASMKEVGFFVTLLKLRLTPWHRAKFHALQVPEWYGDRHVVTSRFVEAAHRKNIQVHVYDVDDKETMNRLISAGVDGIMTDRPDVLSAVISSGP